MSSRRYAWLLLPCLALGACRAQTPRAAPAPQPAAPAAAPTVSFDASSTAFPPRWRRGTVGASARPLDPARRATAQAWLGAALAKYPDGFLGRYVESIHLVGGLTFRGVQAGGTNSRRRIYVVVPSGHAAQIYFERVVHAEISSILLRRHRDRFDQAAWREGTIPGFRYGASGAAAVRHGVAATWPTTWALKQGFLYEYGMSSVENDFNSYAGFAFTHPERLLRYGAEWPAGVGLKRALTLDFYRSLDPRFASLGSPDLPSVELGR